MHVAHPEDLFISSVVRGMLMAREICTCHGIGAFGAILSL
jgi:hypothetical protein